MMTPRTNIITLVISLSIMEIFVMPSQAVGRINVLLRSPNITICPCRFNSVTLFWDPEEPEQMENFTIAYILSHKYHDNDKKEKTEKLYTSQATIKLYLHPGFTARVQALLEDEHANKVAESKCTEYVYRVSSPAYIHNVTCQIYKLTNLNCSWDIQKDAPKDINYSFSLRYKSYQLPCLQYLENQEKKNIGCHMKDVISKLLLDSGMQNIKIQFSHQNGSFLKLLKLADIEVLNPPINISLTSENGKTIIKWKPPPSIQSNLADDCFVFEIMVFETEHNIPFRVVSSENLEYMFTDLDKDRRYSFQIRGRKNKRCVKSRYWGEWSKPHIIGTEEIQPFLIITLVLVFFGIVIICVLIRYLVRFFNTAIPDPSSKIKYWMSNNDIYFQKCVAEVNNECLPIAQIEVVTSSPDCNQDNEP